MFCNSVVSSGDIPNDPVMLTDPRPGSITGLPLSGGGRGPGDRVRHAPRRLRPGSPPVQCPAPTQRTPSSVAAPPDGWAQARDQRRQRCTPAPSPISPVDETGIGGAQEQRASETYGPATTGPETTGNTRDNPDFRATGGTDRTRRTTEPPRGTGRVTPERGRPGRSLNPSRTSPADGPGRSRGKYDRGAQPRRCLSASSSFRNAAGTLSAPMWLYHSSTSGISSRHSSGLTSRVA